MEKQSSAAEWSGPLNLRDLGGIPVQGGSTPWRRVWRSDDINRIGVRFAEMLVGEGLTTVIDLRSTVESESSSTGPLTDLGVDRIKLPLTERNASPAGLQRRRQRPSTATEMGQWYTEVFLDKAPLLAEGLTAIAEQDGIALFHCAAGKDRAGIFAAALLSVLGADHASIISDYARSDVAMTGIIARYSLNKAEPTVGNPQSRVDNPVLSALPDSMRVMLEAIDQEPGGAIGILEDAGLDRAAIKRLRTRLVEPHSEASAPVGSREPASL